jgi:hypothetical protein
MNKINMNGYFEEVLQAIDNFFNNAISRHNKILFVRFDLRFNDNSTYQNDNRLLSRFMEALTLHCKRLGLDPLYLWVREQATSNNHHYHVILLLDGNKIQNPYGIFNKATELWGMCLNTDATGLVQYGKHIMIRRNDNDFDHNYNEALKLAGYLAKSYSKGSAPKGVREMGMSNLF